MTGALEVAPWQDARLEVRCEPGRTVIVRGEIAMRDPLAELQPHFRALHQAARAGGDVTVDVTELRFMNSSAIRLFLDWATWIRGDDVAARYRVRYRTSSNHTWQRTAFPAIRALVGDVVVLEPS